MASTARSRSSGATSTPPQQQQSRLGNLGSVLMSYDHSSGDESSSSQHQYQQHQQQMGHELTIDVPGRKSVNAIDSDGIDDDDDDDDDEQQQHDDGDVDDDERERSLTLGSEFDLNWITGAGGGKEGRGMSIGSGMFTPMGEECVSSTMDDPTVVSSDVSAYASSSARRGPTTTTTTATTTTTTTHQQPSAGGAQRWQQHQLMPARLRGDSTASASHFLNGLFHEKQQSHPPRACGGQMTIAHTPPTQMLNSYENSRFGKRMRAGVSSHVFLFP